jgi:hypothetical protein
MRQRLMIVSIVLFAATAAGLWRFRTDYRQAQERYRILQAAQPAAAPAPAPAPAPGPVQPGSFLDAAAKFLFSPDRNPTVVVEQPKVKPRPALPQLYGVMNLGDGPIALMTIKPSDPHKPVRAGETIGEFKLLAASGDHITLEWDGQKIERQVSDLLVRGGGETSAGGGGGGAPISTTGGSQTPGAGPGTQKVNPSVPVPQLEYMIGAPMQGANGTVYASPPGDTAPDGAILNGKKKVVRQTPFGSQAWWEDVK